MTTSSTSSKVTLATNIATVLFGITIFLQLLLAAGVLPVSMAWGGTQDVLTPSLRYASLASMAILAFFAYVIRRRAGLSKNMTVTTIVNVLAWIITAYLFLVTLGNITSPSMGEKLLFGPISFFLAISCLLVSKSKTE